MQVQVRLRKALEITYLELNKQQSRFRQIFSMLKDWRRGNKIILTLILQTSKVQCKYLGFKNLKISSKKLQQRLES